MRTVYRRRFAGFTSFISNLCFSHNCSIGPEGTLPSRMRSLAGAIRSGAGGGAVIVLAIGAFASLTDDSGQNGEGRDRAAARDEERGDEREAPEEPIVLAAVDAERLEHAPNTVV